MIPIVTIDGPAASGKTSVSRGVAAKLGWKWLSTGAFYRGLAYIAYKEGTALDDEQALVALTQASTWQVKMTDEQTLFIYQDEDVTEKIFLEEVGDVASKISQYPEFRQRLLQPQRDCAIDVPGLVAEGRDCDTVVFPEAPVKIYLTARSSSRAERRAKEQGADVESMKQAQKIRDAQDSNRQASPMQIPDKAHVVDTSELNLDQVVQVVVDIVQKSL